MRVIFSKNLNIWLRKLVLVLLLDYMFLFGLESILPGFVMEVLNLNYLLLIILAIGFYLFITPVETVSKPDEKLSFKEKILIGLGMAYLVVVAAFSLYKTEKFQIALYILLAIISSFLLYKVLMQSVKENKQ